MLSTEEQLASQLVTEVSWQGPGKERAHACAMACASTVVSTDNLAACLTAYLQLFAATQHCSGTDCNELGQR